MRLLHQHEAIKARGDCKVLLQNPYNQLTPCVLDAKYKFTLKPGGIIAVAILFSIQLGA
jgi:hypothetical protein